MSCTLEGEPLIGDEVNVVVIGDPKVGKSAIVQQYARDGFPEDYTPTIGVDFNSRLVQTEGKFVHVHMWDCSGEETFLWAAKKHIQKADGFVFVYDVTSERSFSNLSHWLQQVQRFAKAPNLPKMLVGNKADLRMKQVIGASRAKEFGIPEGMSHVEVSARSGRYLNVVFYVLCTEILRYRTLGCIIPLGVRSYTELPEARQEAELADAGLSGEGGELEDGPEYKQLFKILLVGAPRVGKTCLRYRFCKNHYTAEYSPTAGFDYSTRTLLIDGERVKVQVWDISGDSVYDATRANYSKGANGFLMVFDATNMDSFVAAEQLLKELDMCGCDRAPKLLVGNKVDQKRKKQVDFGTAKDFSDGWKVPYLETSARYGTNVDIAFKRLIVALKRQHAPWKKLYDFA